MGDFFKKLWPYLLILGVLAAIALWGDGWLKAPWADEQEEVSEPTVEDTVSAELEEMPSIALDTVDNKPLQQEDTEAKKWRLVVGSFPDKARADHLAEKLQGSVEIRYVDYLSTYRVVYGSYDGLPEAQQAYEEVKLNYPEGWVVYF